MHARRYNIATKTEYKQNYLFNSYSIRVQKPLLLCLLFELNSGLCCSVQVWLVSLDLKALQVEGDRWEQLDQWGQVVLRVRLELQEEWICRAREENPEILDRLANLDHLVVRDLPDLKVCLPYIVHFY